MAGSTYMSELARAKLKELSCLMERVTQAHSRDISELLEVEEHLQMLNLKFVAIANSDACEHSLVFASIDGADKMSLYMRPRSGASIDRIDLRQLDNTQAKEGVKLLPVLLDILIVHHSRLEPNGT